MRYNHVVVNRQSGALRVRMQCLNNVGVTYLSN